MAARPSLSWPRFQAMRASSSTAATSVSDQNGRLLRARFLRFGTVFRLGIVYPAATGSGIWVDRQRFLPLDTSQIILSRLQKQSTSFEEFSRPQCGDRRAESTLPNMNFKGSTDMPRQRISYVATEDMTADMREEMERCRREGTPRPESSAIRAHVPACFWFFANSWRDIYRNGIVDHSIKELCRLYVSRSVQCEYCGNQRSVKAKASGTLIEDHVMDLLNFEKSSKYSERQKAALAYAEAITWHLMTDDAFWDRMQRNFSEPELVELGCMIGLTLGQQSWLRLLNIDHHQVMAGTSASMAPGYEDEQKLKEMKSSPGYWAKSKMAASNAKGGRNVRRGNYPASR